MNYSFNQFNSILIQKTLQRTLHRLHYRQSLYVQLQNYEENSKTIVYHLTTILQKVGHPLILVISWYHSTIHKQFQKGHYECQDNYARFIKSIFIHQRLFILLKDKQEISQRKQQLHTVFNPMRCFLKELRIKSEQNQCYQSPSNIHYDQVDLYRIHCYYSCQDQNTSFTQSKEKRSVEIQHMERQIIIFFNNILRVTIGYQQRQITKKVNHNHQSKEYEYIFFEFVIIVNMSIDQVLILIIKYMAF
ncbi:unnamed protein product [Paramecium octaurelia]|uniref:Uncharacterized protein n=1 Tax=Paramecium octaurelia TaxID=43137 RepID=A0A8S1VXE0_PAROT|nr:unnamed protein product [Paramecium octaurelia]